MTGRLFVRPLGLILWFSLAAAASAAAPKTDAAPEKPAAKPDAATPADAPAKPEAPATHTVAKGLLKVTVELDGTFETQTVGEIVVRPEEWAPGSPLTVVSAVKHGARVRQGDVLVTFDTEKLDRAIDDLTAELQLTDLGLQQADEQLKALEKTTPMDLEVNARTARISEEDRKYYFETERPFSLKLTEFQLKSAKDSLEYAAEELRQLERMYQADDVTEETEAIVLKRQRDQVEAARLSLASAQLRHDQTLKFNLPRADDRLRDVTARNLLECERNRIMLPVLLQKQRLEVERLRVQRSRSAERLKKLQADREGMTIKAPLDGVVYYGKCTRGKFADAQTVAEMLRPQGNVLPNQVFLTLVQPPSLAIRASVPEEQLHRVRVGVSGVAVPTGFPTAKLPAVLTRLGEVPISPGSFDAQLKVTLGKDAAGLVPGMGCKVKLVPYLNKEALTVPAKALQLEELDDQPFVYVVAKDGKPTKRPVTVGQKTDKLVEILKGVSVGERVLLEAPKDAK